MKHFYRKQTSIWYNVILLGCCYDASQDDAMQDTTESNTPSSSLLTHPINEETPLEFIQNGKYDIYYTLNITLITLINSLS